MFTHNLDHFQQELLVILLLGHYYISSAFTRLIVTLLWFEVMAPSFRSKRSPDHQLYIYTSTLNIVPLVVYSAGFVKCFDIAVFLILNQYGQLVNQRKKTIFFPVVNLFFKALNFGF